MGSRGRGESTSLEKQRGYSMCGDRQDASRKSQEHKYTHVPNKAERVCGMLPKGRREEAGILREEWVIL